MFSLAMKYAKKENARTVKIDGKCQATRDQIINSSTTSSGVITTSPRLIERAIYEINTQNS